MVAYTAACIVVGTLPLDGGNEDKVLVMRLVLIAAMGFLGNYYFRIQRRRLAEATQAEQPPAAHAAHP